jgi:enoyl-CoA hydratase/carnithine racemase
MPPHRIALPPTLGTESLAALGAELERLGADADSGPWILHGADGTFCRGMDLAGMSSSTDDAPPGPRAFAECLALLRSAPRPTIALVDGAVLGGGIGIAAACDVVLATPRSTFGLPEALIGLLPAIVMPLLLERLTPQRARLLALSGASRDASWALAAGLVDEIVAEDAIDKRAARVARDLGRVGPRAVRELRGLVDEARLLSAEAALDRGVARTTAAVADPVTRENVRRFVEDGELPWSPR